MTTPTRRDVLERLAADSAAAGETTSVAALAGALDAEVGVVATHLDGLAAAELAVYPDDDAVRVSVTGEELLALDPDDLAVVVPDDGG